MNRRRLLISLVLVPVAVFAGGPTKVLEQMVARVNNGVITTFELQKAQEQLVSDAHQPGVTNPDAFVASGSKNLLRDLIDQRLLEQRASDLGLNADTEVVKRLDDIRRSQNLPSLEDLQKAVEAQGQDYDDFKQSLKSNILSQMVISQDIAPRVQVTPEEDAAYYNAHKGEFVRQDEVGLSEILISTKDKPEAELPRLKKLADEVRVRAAKGETFATLAKRYSQGQTASSGGDIGFFKKGSLAPELEKQVFGMDVNSVTPVLTTANGYLILKVNAVHHAGQETLEEARREIEYRLYEQKLQPELRHYLSKLRNESYIVIAKGYNDTGKSDIGGVNVERFERVLPQDMPKPVDKKK